ncbi:MAG: redox-sensing transcriptional repressor Rex [Oscillospiraceae bacterium]
MNGETEIRSISRDALRRLPIYLDYFKHKKLDGCEFILSEEAEADLNTCVKEDLYSAGAVPDIQTGAYNVNEVIETLNSFLDCENSKDAVIVGAGQLGKTLLAYDGFSSYGLNIVAAFDIDPAVIGGNVRGKQIFSVEKMKNLCERMNIHIGIITVPARSAQRTAELMVKCGIKAIWNFSPVILKLPDDIIVQDENMAASLAVLSNKLKQKMKDNF